MDQVIRQVHDIIRPRMCNACGAEINVAVFEIQSSPVQTGINIRFMRGVQTARVP